MINSKYLRILEKNFSIFKVRIPIRFFEYMSDNIENLQAVPFLRQLAAHYVGGGEDLKGLCFVFPNRRSMVFFRKWLAEEVTARLGRAVVAPQMLTVNDFFIKSAGLRPADRIGQLIDLYSCYGKLYPKAESLDEFIYWGDVILGDFNDIDKYLVDPESIFTNISDLKAIQDDYSHLTPTQREAIGRFLSHFREKDMRVSANLSSGRGRDVKGVFREIWDILFPLYKSFNALLESRGEAYEGAIYRRLAQKVREEPVADLMAEVFPHTSKFIFAGLNALNACEKAVLKKMKEAGIAEFCWDYCGPMIRDPHNRSSLFMEENLRIFPSALPSEAFYRGVPEVTVVSVPSSVGQIKLVSDILKGEKPDDCAVVLPDESLLMPLLNSIDPQIDRINVTMGYPLQASELHSLMKSLSVMQLHRRVRNGSCSFWYKPVQDVLANGIFRKATAGDSAVLKMIEELRAEPSYYIAAEKLAVTTFTSLIFSNLDLDSKGRGADVAVVYAKWQKEVVSAVAEKLAGNPEMALEIDLAKEYWNCVNRLEGIAKARGEEFNISLQSYISLLNSLLAGVAVPFNGEPLAGMQIMGPLETRALDFRNVVLLSCNEGVFPGRQSSNSFIPAELRRGFDLPTPDYRDAMWAYYFYRMISRAEKVWLVYDSRTEGVKSGEESRFIKQLNYHFNLKINWRVASAPLKPVSFETEIPKTQEDVDFLREHCVLSPSSLNEYISCPAKLYFSKVKGLRGDDEISENLDASNIGTIYHNVMRAIYMGMDELRCDRSFDKLEKGNLTVGVPVVTAEYLRECLGQKELIRHKIAFFICDLLRTDSVRGRNLVTAEIILEYVLKTLARDIELLESQGAGGFTIVGLEQPLRGRYGGFRFMGSADRIDSLDGVNLRMLDYKTGADEASILDVKDGNEEELAASVFDRNNPKRKDVKALLQFWLYDRMLRDSEIVRPYKGLIYNSMYSAPSMFKKGLGMYTMPEAFNDAMAAELDSLLAGLADVDTPFAKTDNEKTCQYCDFKTICGK